MKGLIASSSSASSLLFSQHPSNSSFQFSHNRIQPQQKATTFISFSSSTSSSSSSSVVEEQQDSPSVSLVDDVNDDSNTLPLDFSGCKSCGRESIERGCNGDGRIQGGIATIPGFGWWPIKAYRPCPGFLASGGNYRRQGQSFDEVAFGGGKKSSIDDSKKRKKGKSRMQSRDDNSSTDKL